MFLVIVAMVPCLLFGMWNIGHQYHLSLGASSDLLANVMVGAWKVIPLIVVSYGVGLGIEFCLRECVDTASTRATSCRAC